MNSASARTQTWASGTVKAKPPHSVGNCQNCELAPVAGEALTPDESTGPGFEPGPLLPQLRVHAVQHAREGNDLANVFGAAEPGHGAFEAQAETGVGHAAKAPQVQVPLEGVFR